MNRNTENWLKAIGMVFGFISATALFIWGLWMFFASYPKYFEYTIVIILLGIGLFGLIKLIKDHLDDKDKSDKYYREMYPSYYEQKYDTSIKPDDHFGI